MSDDTASQFAEIQGLYGPVTVSERLIQRIWLRGDYDGSGLKTLNGHSLTVHQSGRWNLQEGPDFLGADLTLNGVRKQGDVEIHFYERDWFAHGHQTQKHFNDVILHVVVFPPSQTQGCITLRGHRPETLCLLPHLTEDLEAYAAQEALNHWQGQDAASVLEGFLALALEESQTRLIDNAMSRFTQKVAFARKRLVQTDWESVCHQMTLEVLGYRRNRGPMSAIAQQIAPNAFANADIEKIYNSQTTWKLAGLRPANHPKHRLQQYQSLLRACPDWQSRMVAWGKSQRMRAGKFIPDTKSYRKTKRLSAQRRELTDDILGGNIGGTRFDTLMIDAFFPLLAIEDPGAWFPFWFHWFPGDMPDIVDTVLQQSGIPEEKQPRCNGWNQGAWQLFLESGL